MDDQSRSVVVIFIRHAESEENVKSQYVHDLVVNLLALKLPTWQQLSQSFSLLQMDLDAPVSALGKRQLQDMKLLLHHRGFWADKEPYINTTIPTSSSATTSEAAAGVVNRSGGAQLLVAYSPLQRAVETCFTLLPNSLTAATAAATESNSTNGSSHIQCVEQLRELHPLEQLIPSKVHQRTSELEHWLNTVIANNRQLRCVILVGHCQFFNRLLNMKTRMRNCDVWRAQYTPLKSTATPAPGTAVVDDDDRWKQVTLLHRSFLSLPHPLDRLLKRLKLLTGLTLGKRRHSAENSSSGSNYSISSSSSGSSSSDCFSDDDDDFVTYESARETHTSAATATAATTTTTTTRRNPYSLRSEDTTAGADVIDDLDDESEEPLCRICQLRQSEVPELKMIRPCLCSGSVSHVHVQCLNQWRATSTTAYYTCSICKFPYRTERTWLAQLLVQENAVLLLAVLMVLALSLCTGLTLMTVISILNVPIDPVVFIYDVLEVDSFWAHCNRRRVVSLDRVIAHIYSHSDGITDLIRGFIQFLRSPLLMMFIACHPWVSSLLHIFIVGAILVGTTGFVHFIVGLLQRIRHGGGGQWFMQCAMVAMWLASLGVKALSRLCLVVGCMIATRELYSSLVVQARLLSHWIGDRILEPHAAHSSSRSSNTNSSSGSSG